ncbi:hypothetical protein, partial [uncultured Alistipes sp.]|uniref:hypothetical protein n=1 Tax=uncultured Alistipes sp. TaxID=538949 RepID=UPI00272BF848
MVDKMVFELFLYLCASDHVQKAPQRPDRLFSPRWVRCGALLLVRGQILLTTGGCFYPPPNYVFPIGLSLNLGFAGLPVHFISGRPLLVGQL